MKFFNTLKVAILASLAALAATALPAAAQTTTTTNPTTTTCTVGCPQTVTIGGMAQWGGVVHGGFGMLDSSGNLVTSPNVTGTVTAIKSGGGDVVTGVNYNGCLSLTCGNTTTTATVSAFERGQVAVTGATNTPGTMLTLANFGALSAVSGIALQYNPGSAPAPAPTH